MQNPITELRKELGLTRQEFATLIDVSYVYLTQTECGYYKHPRTVFDSIACQNAQYLRDIDVMQLASRFENWWEHRRQALASRIAETRRINAERCAE